METGAGLSGTAKNMGDFPLSAHQVGNQFAYQKGIAAPDEDPMPTDPLDDFILAAAKALDLPLEPDWQPAVKANLAVTLQQAALVAEFELPDEAEPAPVFRA